MAESVTRSERQVRGEKGSDPSTARLRVGLFPPAAQLSGGRELDAMLARAIEVEVDHLCVGDHVSFFVGAGRMG
jgi:hypothetical protein